MPAGRSPYASCAPRSSTSPSSGEILEIAGPRAEDLVEMASLLAARRGDPARV